MGAPFELNVQAGMAPPGPARLLGGPMDGTVIPMVYLTPWIAVSWPGSEGAASAEWYARMAVDKNRVSVYTHISVRDSELDWETILGFNPWTGQGLNDDDDDDGEDPVPVYTGP